MADLAKFVSFAGGFRPHPLWYEFFGPYPWFYLPLAGAAVATEGLSVSRIFEMFKYRSLHDPDLDNMDYNQWGQWRQISLNQFKASLGQSLVRLDKAIVAGSIIRAFMDITTKEEMLEQHYRLIIPSVFVIEGIERNVINEPKLVDHLSFRTGQRRILFEEIMKGQALIEYIAHEIVRLCHDAGMRRVDMRLLKDRGDTLNGGLTRPASSQQLDVEKIKSFYF